MSWFAVEKALVASIDNMNLSHPIVQENVELERKQNIQNNNDFWIEHFLLPSGADPLSKDGLTEYNGVFQVSINGQLNKGKGGILQLADQILASYVTGEIYSNSGCDVNIYTSTIEPPREDGSFYVIDLSIEFGAYISR